MSWYAERERERGKDRPFVETAITTRVSSNKSALKINVVTTKSSRGYCGYQRQLKKKNNQ